jgi:ABC-2 type transport system permease protein
MNMILKIAAKEMKEVLRDGRFRVLSALCLVLLVVAAFSGKRYYDFVNTQHKEAAEKERLNWTTQEAKNPHSAAHYGTYAFKPKYPMSLLDQGVDKYTGVSIYLEAHVRNEAQFIAAQDQTGLSRFGDLTPDFILLFLVPLLIILVGFNAITRERESGTLRLLQSMGVSPVRLVLGKWLGIIIPVILLTVIAFLLAALFLGNLSDFGELSWSALLILFVVYVLYYAIFSNIVLLVSAWVNKSSVAFVILLAVWMVTCLGMPKVVTNLADQLYPYPTQQEFIEAVNEDKKKGLDGHDPWNDAARKLEQEVLAEYGVDSVQQLPFNFDGYLMQKGEEHEAEIFFKHYEHLKQIYEKQSRLYRNAAAVSPFLPARFLSMAMCRTDYHSHWHFSNEAEKYRLEMMNALNMDFADNSSYGDWSYKSDPELWNKIEPFDYTPPTYASVLSANTGNFVVLVVWLVISFGIVVIRCATLKP